jgi:hypothetical protein
MHSLMRSIEKGLQLIAETLDTKIEGGRIERYHLKNGDTRIKLSFLIKKHDQKTSLPSVEIDDEVMMREA